MDYSDYYAPAADAAVGERSRLWRELSANGKADHVIELIARAGLAQPETVVEVGCGNGAVLAELGRRGLGSHRIGLDISESGVKLATQRPEIDEVALYDGVSLPAADRGWDIVIASHVLEHIADPLPLLAEMARAGKAVVVEVPLEINLSARRPTARTASADVGHVHRFDRRTVDSMLQSVGLTVSSWLLDPLPREVHTFWADRPARRARGTATWAIRRVLASVPPLAERLVTLHYAVLAVPTEP